MLGKRGKPFGYGTQNRFWQTENIYNSKLVLENRVNAIVYLPRYLVTNLFNATLISIYLYIYLSISKLQWLKSFEP